MCARVANLQAPILPIFGFKERNKRFEAFCLELRSPHWNSFFLRFSDLFSTVSELMLIRKTEMNWAAIEKERELAMKVQQKEKQQIVWSFKSKSLTCTYY